MTTIGLTDVIGPIMVGPSSSHTAGALGIAYMARKLCSAKPVFVEFRLMGSFAHTLTGHGTNKALVAGMLGFKADDLRIRDSFSFAAHEGLSFTFTPLADANDFDHPNTVDIIIKDASGNTLNVRGESIGGGAAVIRRIDGIDVYITGEHTSVVVRQQDVSGVLAHIAQTLSDHGVNIATTRLYREQRGQNACTVLETDHDVSEGVKQAIEQHPAIHEVRVIPRADEPSSGVCSSAEQQDTLCAIERFTQLDFASGEALLELCKKDNYSLSQAFLEREKALASSLGKAGESQDYLSYVLQVMKESASQPLHKTVPSMGGLIGGEAHRLQSLYNNNGSLVDEQLAKALSYAMAVLETNASMGRIVAAPTAGSAGVVPGVLLALQDTHGFSDEDLERGLAAAAAVGYLITRNATVSGAEGGCQAEIGSAAAMAAAAATELAGGTVQQCLDAAANALTNMMGLVCDPIAGLVEVPCQKRNAAGAATALVSAQIALAGIPNLVNFDQTVEAMDKVGRSLPFELRESALGGIAATPAACTWRTHCS